MCAGHDSLTPEYIEFLNWRAKNSKAIHSDPKMMAEAEKRFQVLKEGKKFYRE
jgi:hypothetical protein